MDSCLYGLPIALFLMKPQSKTEFMGKVMSCYNPEKADITRFGKMKRAILLLSILMLAAVGLPACGKASPIPMQGREVKVDGGSYWDITPAQLKSMLKNKDFLLVNVHIPYGGEIPDTDLFVPYNEIGQNLSKFSQNKQMKIVLYCRSGSMSTTAARTLVNPRLTNVLAAGVLSESV